MALTASVQYTKREPESQSFEVANGETIYNGAYVALNTAGFAVNVVDTTAFEPVGFAVGFDAENADQTNVTGDGTDAFEVAVDISGTILENIPVTGLSGQTDVGALVYATDENTFTLSATSNIPAVGVVTRYVSNTSVDVLFFSFEQMRGN